MGFGLSADHALKSLRLLGDVAAVSGGDLNGMTVAFGQAAAEGRLMTRDIMQLVNNGVPAYKLLAEEVGVTTSEIRKMASDGEITFEILEKALQRATAEGGMFENGMEVLSGTLGGVASTLRDNLSIALAEVEAKSSKHLICSSRKRRDQICPRFGCCFSESKQDNKRNDYHFGRNCHSRVRRLCIWRQP